MGAPSEDLLGVASVAPRIFTNFSFSAVVGMPVGFTSHTSIPINLRAYFQSFPREFHVVVASYSLRIC